MKIAFVEWYPRICGVTEVTNVKTGLTFVEMVAAVKNSGWKTSSPNPEGILRWHLGHLEHERGLVERV
jgi:hypothetical protein